MKQRRDVQMHTFYPKLSCAAAYLSELHDEGDRLPSQQTNELPSSPRGTSAQPDKGIQSQETSLLATGRLSQELDQSLQRGSAEPGSADHGNMLHSGRHGSGSAQLTAQGCPLPRSNAVGAPPSDLTHAMRRTSESNANGPAPASSQPASAVAQFWQCVGLTGGLDASQAASLEWIATKRWVGHVLMDAQSDPEKDAGVSVRLLLLPWLRMQALKAQKAGSQTNKESSGKAQAADRSFSQVPTSRPTAAGSAPEKCGPVCESEHRSGRGSSGAATTATVQPPRRECKVTYRETRMGVDFGVLVGKLPDAIAALLTSANSTALPQLAGAARKMASLAVCVRAHKQRCTKPLAGDASALRAGTALIISTPTLHFVAPVIDQGFCVLDATPPKRKLAFNLVRHLPLACDAPPPHGHHAKSGPAVPADPLPPGISTAEGDAAPGLGLAALNCLARACRSVMLESLEVLSRPLSLSATH